MTMKDLVSRAEAFARVAHAGQTRKGAAEEPYANHLEEVADFVRRHGGDDVAVAAAWLHDTVEDCGVPSMELERQFGPDVAAVVAELTDDKRLPKGERKRRQVETARNKSPRAALVKLGDKTSNVRAVGASPPKHWDIARCNAYVDWAVSVADGLPGDFRAAREELAEAARLTKGVLSGR
jgi:(p)ppGpp synthase/HD superfamily hydrolase